MKRFQTGGTVVDTAADKLLGRESSLSNWAGDYVTGMLGKGRALADKPYETYKGPLTAGESGLQTQAFQGLAGLSMPTAQMGAYTPQSFTGAGVAEQYMNPYLDAVLAPQIAAQQRQAEIARTKNASRMTGAGSYGGGRQAVLEGTLQGEMLRNMGDIYGKEYGNAYTSGLGQFNKEQEVLSGAQQDVNKYGFDLLDAFRTLGGEQRGIDAEGILADKTQFEEERDYPYKALQFQQSLLEGLPVAAQSYNYSEPSDFTNFLGGAGGILKLLEQLGIGTGDGENGDGDDDDSNWWEFWNWGD